MDRYRREFLAAASGLAAVASSRTLHAQESSVENQQAEAAISAPEDLMREHGVLNRILLIYEDALRRLAKREELPPQVVQAPAQLVRRFVEDYHERLEERFIFPAFEERQQQIELVSVLREQHQAGRKLTDRILRASTGDVWTKQDNKNDVVRACGTFIRMYRPHEAREDTVLFPALYEILAAERIKELGEQFEEEEHRHFGEDGFHKTVEEVAEIERQLGIHDLALFTPT